METEFRKNARLTDYDYAGDGYYFVTVVTRNRLPLLKNCSGECESAIRNLPQFVKGLAIDYFVVMDDHIHVIFVFEGCARPLGRVVAAMKSAITKIVLTKNLQCSGECNFAENEGDSHRPLHWRRQVNPQNVAAGVSPRNKVGSHRPLHWRRQVNPQNVAAGVSPRNKVGSHRPLQLWQWNYYEHVIRNERALSKIREYIRNNPEAEKLNWGELDK